MQAAACPAPSRIFVYQRIFQGRDFPRRALPVQSAASPQHIHSRSSSANVTNRVTSGYAIPPRQSNTANGQVTESGSQANSSATFGDQGHYKGPLQRATTTDQRDSHSIPVAGCSMCTTAGQYARTLRINRPGRGPILRSQPIDFDTQYSRKLAIRSPSSSRMATSRMSLRWPLTRSSKRASHSAIAVDPST